MATGDVYQGEQHFTLQSNPNTYCFFYQITTEVNESVASRDVAVHMKDVVFPLIQALTVDTAIFHCVTGKEVWPKTSIVEVQETPGIGGQDKGLAQILPGQCNMVAQLYGDQANPTASNKGRDFWTGWISDDQEDGKFESSATGVIQTFYETLPKSFTSTNGNVFDWGVFSMKLAKQSPPVPFFFTVKLIRINKLVRTQRRRQPEDPCPAFVTFDPNL